MGREPAHEAEKLGQAEAEPRFAPANQAKRGGNIGGQGPRSRTPQRDNEDCRERYYYCDKKQERDCHPENPCAVVHGMPVPRTARFPTAENATSTEPSTCQIMDMPKATWKRTQYSAATQHPAENPESHPGILAESRRIGEEQDHAGHTVQQKRIERRRLLVGKKKLSIGRWLS